MGAGGLGAGALGTTAEGVGVVAAGAAAPAAGPQHVGVDGTQQHLLARQHTRVRRNFPPKHLAEAVSAPHSSTATRLTLISPTTFHIFAILLLRKMKARARRAQTQAMATADACRQPSL